MALKSGILGQAAFPAMFDLAGLGPGCSWLGQFLLRLLRWRLAELPVPLWLEKELTQLRGWTCPEPGSGLARATAVEGIWVSPSDKPALGLDPALPLIAVCLPCLLERAHACQMVAAKSVPSAWAVKGSPGHSQAGGDEHGWGGEGNSRRNRCALASELTWVQSPSSPKARSRPPVSPLVPWHPEVKIMDTVPHHCGAVSQRRLSSCRACRVPGASRQATARGRQGPRSAAREAGRSRLWDGGDSHAVVHPCVASAPAVEQIKRACPSERLPRCEWSRLQSGRCERTCAF